MSCSFYHPTQVMLSDLRYYLSSSYSYSTRIKTQIVLHCDNSYFWPYSPSPVTKSAKIFEFRENFSFRFLHRPMNSRKILMQTTKWSTSSKIANFYKWWKITILLIFKCGDKIQMPANYISLERKFIMINNDLRAEVQKWTYFELWIENRKDIFLKVVNALLKIVTIWKSDLTKP